MSETTPEEAKLLRHTVGLDNASKAYRNRYAAGRLHPSMPVIQRLIDKGMMEAGDIYPTAHGDMTFYHATDAGCRAVGTTLEEAEA